MKHRSKGKNLAPLFLLIRVQSVFHPWLLKIFAPSPAENFVKNLTMFEVSSTEIPQSPRLHRDDT